MSKYLDRSKEIGAFKEEPDDDLIICRCEEITKGEIREAVHMGMWTLTEVKRLIRPCMGLCQGQTCQKHVKNIIAKELGVSPKELDDITSRSPMRPINIGVFAKEVENK